MQRVRGVELRPIRPPKPTAEPGLLWCGTCKQFRDETEFGWDGTRNQPNRRCRPCHAAEQRRYNGQNREQVNLQRRLRKRGLSVEEYEALMAAQEGRCAICRKDRPLDIDHCHRAGHVRGLLCGPCNRALGFFEDDAEIIRAALSYLGA